MLLVISDRHMLTNWQQIYEPYSDLGYAGKVEILMSFVAWVSRLCWSGSDWLVQWLRFPTIIQIAVALSRYAILVVTVNTVLINFIKVWLGSVLDGPLASCLLL